MSRRITHALALSALTAAASCGPNGEADVAELQGCPPLPAPHDRHYAEASPVEGPFASHRNDAWREGTELIEVRWLPIGFPFGLHEVIVYTNAAGAQKVIAAFPEREVSFTLDFGTIVMAEGAYDPQFKKPFTQDLDDDSVRTIVASGSDLAATWADMERVAAIIDRLGVDYHLFRVNSNSAAETVLKHAGYPRTDDPLWGDVAADEDIIARALNKGDATCDDPDDQVNRALR